MSAWLLPVLIVVMLGYGIAKGVAVYDAMIEGAKEGFQVAIRIIPFLVAILVAAGMFRASGLLDVIIVGVQPLLSLIGFPAEALPMAVLRPLSGSGAYAIMAEIMQAEGPDSLVGYLVSTLQGSTETTFYVLAVYFGAVGVVRIQTCLSRRIDRGHGWRHRRGRCRPVAISGITATERISYHSFSQAEPTSADDAVWVPLRSSSTSSGSGMRINSG